MVSSTYLGLSCVAHAHFAFNLRQFKPSVARTPRASARRRVLAHRQTSWRRIRDLACPPSSTSSSSSTLEHRTGASASSALVATTALLSKLWRIHGPSDAENLRRRPQVGFCCSFGLSLRNTVLAPVGYLPPLFFCFFSYS
jgi:hypothetical protein